MTLRRKYETNRRSLLLCGEFEIPGTYRKLTDDEIAAEWCKPRKPIPRTQSLTTFDDIVAVAGTNESRNIGNTTDDQVTGKSRRCDDRPKSVSLTHTASSPVRNSGSKTSVTDSSKGTQVESNAKQTGPDAEHRNRTRQICSMPSTPYEDDRGSDLTHKQRTSTFPTKTMHSAYKEKKSNSNSGPTLSERGSSDTPKKRKSRVTRKVSHCSTCKCCELEFVTLIDVSCQTHAHRHTTRKTDSFSPNNDNNDTEKCSDSNDNTSVSTTSSSSSSSSSTTADDKPTLEVAEQKGTRFLVDPPMDGSRGHVLTTKVPFSDISTQTGVRHTPEKRGTARTVGKDTKVKDVQYVDITTSTWMDGTKDNSYVCLGELRKDDVPDLTSTPRKDVHVIAGMATCLDDNPISKFIELNGETLDDPSVVMPSLPDVSVTSEQQGQPVRAEIEAATSRDEVNPETSEESLKESAAKGKHADTTVSETSCPHNHDDASTVCDIVSTIEDDVGIDVLNTPGIMDIANGCDNTVQMNSDCFKDVTIEVQESTLDISSDSELVPTDGRETSVVKLNDGVEPVQEAVTINSEKSTVSGEPNVSIIVSAPSSENIESDYCSESVIPPFSEDNRLAGMPLKKAKVYVESDNTDSTSQSSSSSDDDKKLNSKLSVDCSVPVNDNFVDKNEELKVNLNEEIIEDKNRVVEPDMDYQGEETRLVDSCMSHDSGDIRFVSTDVTNDSKPASSEYVNEVSKGVSVEASIGINEQDKTCLPPEPEQLELDKTITALEVVNNGFETSSDITLTEIPLTDNTSQNNSLTEEPKYIASDSDVVLPTIHTEKLMSEVDLDDSINIVEQSPHQAGECDNDSTPNKKTEISLDISSSSNKSGKDKSTSHTSSSSDVDVQDTPRTRKKKNRMSSMLDKLKHKIFSDGENQQRNENVENSEKPIPVSHSPVKPKRRFRTKSKNKKGNKENISSNEQNVENEMVEIDSSSQLDKLEKSKYDNEKSNSTTHIELVETVPDVGTYSAPTSGLSSDIGNHATDVQSCDAGVTLSSPDNANGVIYITNNAEGSLFLEHANDKNNAHDKQSTQIVDSTCILKDIDNVNNPQNKTSKSKYESQKATDETIPMQTSVNGSSSPPPTNTKHVSKHKRKSPQKDLSRSRSNSSGSDSSHDKDKNRNVDKDKDLSCDYQQPICCSGASDQALSPSITVTSPIHTQRLAHQEAVYTECIPLEAVTSPSATPRRQSYFVVVAIDFGTTYSGYALSFTRDPESVYMMRNWVGGDPGVINQKIPTSILLTPEGEFDSFGFTARDRYHNLEQCEAKNWLYFEKFKMILHHSSCSDDWKILRNNLYGRQMLLTKDTQLYASNGQSFPALKIFSYALRFFKEHALDQLSDQCGINILNSDVRWVITVPAIWKAPAKQFMRQAAYEAGMVSPGTPDQMLIALEPEAASIYCRKLKMYQLVPDSPVQRPLQSPRRSVVEPLNMTSVCTDLSEDMSQLRLSFDLAPNQTLETNMQGTRYLVVDCGGGTVDITVHELDGAGKLKELYKATGGPYGSLGIDIEFEKLLYAIFGEDFIDHYKSKFPVGWVNLMINFESRKRSASPFKSSPLNISMPFSFIDYHKKQKTGHIENVVKKYGDSDICWSSEGMLRLSPIAMKRLFLPTLERIKQTIGDVLNNKYARDLTYLFLVGGFAESPILQQEIRREFSHILKILIPTGVSLAILKGAVLFGLDPTIVNVRRSRLTYGVGVLNRFDPRKHPKSKLVTREGKDWCTDVFEKYVTVDEAVTLGDTVIRSYTPAKLSQQVSIINIYSSESAGSEFITDPGVRKCGTLRLDMTDMEVGQLPARREIQTRMLFGDTEIKVSAMDVTTGRCVKACIDFLNK